MANIHAPTGDGPAGANPIQNMNHEDGIFHITMGEFILQQAAIQAAFMKMAMVRFQQLEDTRRMRARLEQSPDSEEKSDIAAKLSALESSIDFFAETKRMINMLWRVESDQEKMGAVLKALRASLPPPPDDPSPPGPAK